MNLIYQYWDGDVRESCSAGVENMRAYAKSVGAEYIFDKNTHFIRNHFGYDFGKYSPHYGAFKPIFDSSFDKYDKVMFVDTDVFAKYNLDENVFDAFTGEIGICDEPFQPLQRTITKGRITSKQDERWAMMVKNMYGGTEVPRTKEGLVRVFNTGMVLYSKEARLKARELFVGSSDPKFYVDMVKNMNLDSFYYADQNYLGAMMYIHKFDVQEMHNGWNSYIHYTRDIHNIERYMKDFRTDDTKFVHVQFAGADDYDADSHWRIVNLPQGEWQLTKSIPLSL